MPPLCLVWFVAVILTTCQCLLHPAGPPNALPTVGGTTISECSWNISSGFPSWTPGEGGTQAMTKIPWMSVRPSEVPKMTGQNLSLSLYIYIHTIMKMYISYWKWWNLPMKCSFSRGIFYVFLESMSNCKGLSSYFYHPPNWAVINWSKPQPTAGLVASKYWGWNSFIHRFFLAILCHKPMKFKSLFYHLY